MGWLRHKKETIKKITSYNTIEYKLLDSNIFNATS